MFVNLHTKFFRWWIHRNFAKHKGIGLVSLQLLCRELVKRRVEAGEVKFLYGFLRLAKKTAASR